jgi:hypothetical protein
MKKYIGLFTLFSLILLAFAGTEGRKVAVIKMKRGEAVVIKADGSKVPAVKGEWVNQGSVIKTGPRSFVRLSFIDKSTVNVGPKSEMKIEKFSENEAGVLNVLSGKIRSKVTKDYLKMDKEKSKMFVKSKSAVMGVRGTDFVYSYNPKTDASTTVLFEGSIAFNKISNKNLKMQLEQIVNQGHKIAPGQFSISRKGMSKPTFPAKMSSRQIRALEKNENFVGGAKNGAKKIKIGKSIVPPGLTGEVVASTSDALEKGIKKVVQADVKSVNKEIKKEKIKESKGFRKGEIFKPVDGSIVHIESGTIIPLGTDSVFDNNQGEWVSTSVGGVDPAGNYIPPEGYKITEQGELLKQVDGGQLQQVLITSGGTLEETPPLNMMPTAQWTPEMEGPAPAGNIDGQMPPPDGEALPPPPQDCNNCAVPPPPSWGANAPSGNFGNLPRTRVRIQVIKGN